MELTEVQTLFLSTTDVLPLVEANPGVRDGVIPIRIMQPGWGNSGYYPADVLQKAAQDKVFKRGTKMFWDHPTLTEAVERPERSLRDLAAVFETDARWDAQGSRGPGLYVDARVMTPYMEAVKELAPHIGPSIRAFGPAKFGEAEGKSGPIVERIIGAHSVDFVTAPAAGGEILQLFEAARPTGFPAAPPSIPTPTQESEAVDLQEAQRQIQTLETQLTESNRLATETQAENGRLRNMLVLREARDFVVEALTKADKLPDIVRNRLAETISFNPPVTDKGELDKPSLTTKIQESVRSELEYLQAITKSGQPTGMGGGGFVPGGNFDQSAAMQSLQESFQSMGLSESASKKAAGGRVS